MATLQNSCNDSEGLLCRPQECLKINFWQASASSSLGPNIFFVRKKFGANRGEGLTNISIILQDEIFHI